MVKNKKKRCRILNTKAQVTIFIILAIAIFVVLILLFVNQGNLSIVIGEQAPVDQIRKCLQDPVKEGLNILALQGGSITPGNYYLYNGNKIEYLCYTEQNYQKCIMQKPLLKQEIEKSLESYSKGIIKTCIETVKTSLQKNGYEVSSKEINLSVSIVPNSIIISLENFDLKIKKDQTDTYNALKADISSDLYNSLMIASSIVNWESRYGNSEIMTYMIYYPTLRVEKNSQSEGTKIYTITNKNTGEKFMFATRSFALPSGITGN